MVIDGKPVLDEKGQREYTTELVMPVGEASEECQVCDGGDAAGGNAMSALEPPPSKDGCCYYCELRAESWYDRVKCEAAKRRNFIRSTLTHVAPCATRCRVPAAVPHMWV